MLKVFSYALNAGIGLYLDMFHFAHSEMQQAAASMRASLFFARLEV